MLAAALLTSFALTAAPNWTATFGPQESGSYLDGDHAKVLVAAAGAPDSQSKEAAAALVAALRQSGRADLVMTSEPLGDVSALDDASIVKKAAALPVTRIAVVRVFPGAPDQPLTAVVSFYDKAGATTGALSAASGQPLAARTGTSQSEGVSSQAVSAVSGIQKEAVEGSKKAQDEYDLNFIGFNEGVTVNARTGGVMSTWAIPFQGKYRKPLEGVDFYKALGRDDLVKKYESANAARTSLMVAGLLVGGAGLLLPLVGPSLTGGDYLTSFSTFLIPSLILVGVGTGAAYAGIFWNPNPVTPTEARQLGDEHNIELRKKLGLPPLQASLEIGGDRLGLRLSGAF